MSSSSCLFSSLRVMPSALAALASLAVHAQQHLGHFAEALRGDGGGVVNAHVAVIAAVADVVEGIIIVVIHLTGGVLHAVHGDGGGAAGEDAGLHHDQQRGHDDEHHGDAAVQHLAAAVLGGLLGQPLRLGVNVTLLGENLLAGFLFSGCTHLYSFLSKNGRKRPLFLAYPAIIQDNRRFGKGERHKKAMHTDPVITCTISAGGLSPACFTASNFQPRKAAGRPANHILIRHPV